ncbi:hypothetical protein ANO11243_000980 [Dothideomycetidae sp. 11243]|nr:hypothetical protein ANO11243_000980 [fungal sp. No.11243]
MPFYHPGPSPPSPTLTNPDMVLPEDGDTAFASTALPHGARPPSPSYLLGQIESANNATGTHKKSLGSMSKRQGLQRADTADDNFQLPGSLADSSISRLSPAPTQELKDTNEPRWEKPQAQRAISIISTSTISLDLDAIPEYKYDDSESDIFTDFPGSGSVTPTRSMSGEFGKVTDRPTSTRRTSEKFSAELSRRAELILANAKKRLNLMDQNLKGARALTAENLQRATSLHAHESPYTSRYLNSPDRESSQETIKGVRLGHARNRSDIPQLHSPVRARHALAHDSVPEESDDAIIRVATPLRLSKSQELPRASRLGTSGRSIPRGGLRAASGGHPSPSPDTPESNGTSPLTDDLKNKVQNLNKRISLLRERTKEDSMRRQSLQSLRQSSPFTNADHEHVAEETEPNDVRATAQSGTTSADHPLSTSEHGCKTKSSKRRSKAIDWTPISPRKSGTGLGIDNGDNEAPLARDKTDSGGPAHEDREDAFDYHNFFLHSSLGRTSRLSDDASSSISDNTARGPDPIDSETPEKLRQIERGLHKRLSSFNSMTSTTSYVTAAEEARSRQPSPIKSRLTPSPVKVLNPASDGADSGVAGLHHSASSTAVAALQRPNLPQLGLRDKAALFMLVESLAEVCGRLQDPGVVAGEEGRQLRRRLENARRVLDGAAAALGAGPSA